MGIVSTNIPYSSTVLQNNLQELLEVKVIDRTVMILDISGFPTMLM